MIVTVHSGAATHFAMHRNGKKHHFALCNSWEVLPQRFAYDFFMINEEGKSYSGDKTDLKNYFCYGKDILAPADGVVVSVKEGFPDCRIMENGQPDPDTPDIGGNRVIIKHSANEYSAICHLMPGSIRIKKGQLVKRGDGFANSFFGYSYKSICKI